MHEYYRRQNINITQSNYYHGIISYNLDRVRIGSGKYFSTSLKYFGFVWLEET